MNTGTAEPLLTLKDITKQFGRVVALEGVTLDVLAGEVHALLGENGAGKTTLMQVAAGGIAPDSGQVLRSGTPVRFTTPRDARHAGIGLVHQHFSSIPALTVAENIALAAGWPVGRGLESRARALSEGLDLPLDPAARADSLPVALLQRLEIVKALASDARILLLDEPTAVLAPSEAQALLQRARQFAREGGAVVLITHRLDEALASADRVTVLRRGRRVLTASAAELTPEALVEAMIGDPRLLQEPMPGTGPGGSAPWRIRAGGIGVRRPGTAKLAVENAWVSVRAGEIVTIAGVEGSGQQELLRAVAGLVPTAGGTLEVQQPIAFIPEDRVREGIIPDFTLTENMVLGGGRQAPWMRGALLDWAEAGRGTAELIERFDVRAQGPGVLAGTLSGGNQQKLILGRALERRPLTLVAENPTRGLDVQAARAIHDALRAAAAQGTAVLLYSSNLDEVIGLGQRVLVMARGHLHEAPEGAAREEIGRLMLAGRPVHAA